MMDFICSIDDFRASSAPGGRVTVVPVVWDSSLHPHTKQKGASAAGRIRIPLKKDMAVERIGYLTLMVSADVPGRFNIRGVSLEGRLRRAGLRRSRIEESMAATGQAGVELVRDSKYAGKSRVAA
jgi:hypothetical protein